MVMGPFDDLWLWPIRASFTGAFFIVGILLFAFWVWMIVDAAKRNFRNDVEKIVWILVIVIAHWVGALVYFLVIKYNNPKGLMKPDKRR